MDNTRIAAQTEYRQAEKALRNFCDEERIFEKMPFCCFCGQALNWESIEETEAGGNE